MPKKDRNCREKLENLLTDHLCSRIPGWKSRKWKDPKFKSTKWSESNQKQTGDHHTNLAWKWATHLQSSLWNHSLNTLLTWCLQIFQQLFKINLVTKVVAFLLATLETCQPHISTINVFSIWFESWVYINTDFGQHWRCRSPSIRCCTLLDIKAWILYINKKIFLVAINHASCSLSF